MSAVSQSYPNYLGGLNEQPDELKKPGQLVEALNVIPDPTVGLTRRSGFKNVSDLSGTDPAGTWFELELSNQVNPDYIYFGNVRRDGKIFIYNQEGIEQTVMYTKDNTSIVPHKNYEIIDEIKLSVKDENGNPIEYKPGEPEFPLSLTSNNGYFRHDSDNPLSYCVSKNHVVLANSTEVPTLSGAKEASDDDKTRYYSFCQS